ncbi:MAG: hypothetical protein Q4E12_08155 [Coriobacteriia bacterium]|nr:hypothetical protein [Coriobacteriia bacterium]
MKISANRNPYERALGFAWDTFAAHLAGAEGSLLCVVSWQPLGAAAASALEKSAPALGYGPKGCTYLVVQADGALAPTEATRLGEQDLRMALEALDPAALVVTDAQAAALVSRAYGCEVPTNAASRVLGRPCAAFIRMENLLETPEDKQKMWALLKHVRLGG